MVTNAPPPGDYTYNNYGYGNQNNGYGTPSGAPPAYSSSWNNAPNLFTNGAFGNSSYGSPPGYGASPGPSIFATAPPGYGTGYPGAQEWGSFNVGYPNQNYGQGQGQGNYSPGPGNYAPGQENYEESEYAETPEGTPPSNGEEEYCPTPGDTTTPPPDTTTPSPTGTPPASGGTGSDYVDMMMTALKKNGAGPELLEAYMKQYAALGMVPSGTTVPSGGADSTPGVTPTPPGGGPTPSGGPTPTPTPGGTPGPPAVTTPSGQGGAESPEFSDGKSINWDKAPPALQSLKPQIEAASKASGTPETIVAAVIWNESRGNVNVSATDGGSDQGLMQIDNTTYDSEVAGKNGLPHGTTPTDKDQNIMAGATYLAALKEKFGTWDLALRAYNSGENGVDKNNPDATPAGTGIGPYIQYARSHITDLENGTLNPNG